MGSEVKIMFDVGDNIISFHWTLWLCSYVTRLFAVADDVCITVSQYKVVSTEIDTQYKPLLNFLMSTEDYILSLSNQQLWYI